jgi:hypothetical protein
MNTIKFEWKILKPKCYLYFWFLWAVKWPVMGLTARVWFLAKAGNFLSITLSIKFLKPTHPPVQLVLGILSLGGKAEWEAWHELYLQILFLYGVQAFKLLFSSQCVLYHGTVKQTGRPVLQSSHWDSWLLLAVVTPRALTMGQLKRTRNPGWTSHISSRRRRTRWLLMLRTLK